MVAFWAYPLILTDAPCTRMIWYTVLTFDCTFVTQRTCPVLVAFATTAVLFGNSMITAIFQATFRTVLTCPVQLATACFAFVIRYAIIGTLQATCTASFALPFVLTLTAFAVNVWLSSVRTLSIQRTLVAHFPNPVVGAIARSTKYWLNLKPAKWLQIKGWFNYIGLWVDVTYTRRCRCKALLLRLPSAPLGILPCNQGLSILDHNDN